MAVKGTFNIHLEQLLLTSSSEISSSVYVLGEITSGRFQEVDNGKQHD